MSEGFPLKTRIALAGAGSAALLLGALVFQYLGYAPCQVCIWQRWPHGLAIALAFICLIKPNVWLMRLAGLIILAGAGIALYHVGVEQSWWEGPQSCSAGGGTSDLSTSDLLDKLLEAPVVRCDEIAWSLFGISMAGWNGLASLVLTLLWFGKAR